LGIVKKNQVLLQFSGTLIITLTALSRLMRAMTAHIELEGFVISASYQWGKPWRRLALHAACDNALQGWGIKASPDQVTANIGGGQASPVGKMLKLQVRGRRAQSSPSSGGGCTEPPAPLFIN
jgi:hypothetical protein